ncbi:MAG: CapA family protein [Bacteroidales bacterium]|nr:CapA family protein [Bacteroidales bacterium]
MNKFLIIILTLSLVVAAALKVNRTREESPVETDALSAVKAGEDESHLRIVFAGDLMGHTPLHYEAKQKDGSYDYEPNYRYIKDYIESADLAIVNLEVTLAGPPYTGFPCFSAPDALAKSARDAGFDIMTTANNHCMDKGRKGIERTIDVLDSLGIMHLGTYKDETDGANMHPFMIERNGIHLALLNYTYGTNGIPVRKPCKVNLIDTVQIRRDIAEARRKEADFVIAIVHWGIEYQKQGNRQQQELARWLMDEGCNAVIGGHPHVVQNIAADIDTSDDIYPQPVVYSLGNFLSNQHDAGTNGGIMVEMDLVKRKGETKIGNCAYMPYWTNRTTIDGRKSHYIVPMQDALANPDSYHIDARSLPVLQRFAENTYALLHPEGDKRQQIQGRRYYRNGMPTAAYRYTYHFLNYDNLFPRCPDTEPLVVNVFAGELFFISQSPVVEQLYGKYSYMRLKDLGQRGNLKVEDEVSWEKIADNDSVANYTAVVGSETLMARVRKSQQRAIPVANAGTLPGVVTHLWINGKLRFMLKETKTLERPPLVAPYLAM